MSPAQLIGSDSRHSLIAGGRCKARERGLGCDEDRGNGRPCFRRLQQAPARAGKRAVMQIQRVWFPPLRWGVFLWTVHQIASKIKHDSWILTLTFWQRASFVKLPSRRLTWSFLSDRQTEDRLHGDSLQVKMKHANTGSSAFDSLFKVGK